MMPKRYHEHDKKWIKEQLGRVPRRYLEKAATGYTAVFKEAFDAEPVVHKKMNAARYAANTRLRLYVKAVSNKTTAPYS